MKMDPVQALSIDEVFGMAERIEQNAVDFYTKAASLHARTADVAFLKKLAAMEQEHRNRFAAMRAQLPPASRVPPATAPYLHATLYLNTIADAGGGEGTLSNATPLSATDTLVNLVCGAVRMELEAVAFYGAVKEAVPESARSQVDLIIAEERAHVVILVAELRKLTA